jgi:hypothetical protein
MIRKSGNRFSEKIMLNQNARAFNRFNLKRLRSSPRPIGDGRLFSHGGWPVSLLPRPIFDLCHRRRHCFVSIGRMAAFLYRCPNTGLNVQGWIAGDPGVDVNSTYESLTCTACARLHMVNPKNGHVLGVDVPCADDIAVKKRKKTKQRN